jgi:hypothetical protein
MKKLKAWIIFQYNSIHNHIHFQIKKKEADRLHETTGKRYHIVPTGPGTLSVVDNTFIKTYKSLVAKNKRIYINDLIKMSYYSTSVKPLTRK